MALRYTTGLVALALMGCAPSLPDSNPNSRGVGFGNYDQYADVKDSICFRKSVDKVVN